MLRFFCCFLFIFLRVRKSRIETRISSLRQVDVVMSKSLPVLDLCATVASVQICLLPVKKNKETKKRRIWWRICYSCNCRSRVGWCCSEQSTWIFPLACRPSYFDSSNLPVSQCFSADWYCKLQVVHRHHVGIVIQFTFAKQWCLYHISDVIKYAQLTHLCVIYHMLSNDVVELFGHSCFCINQKHSTQAVL